MNNLLGTTANPIEQLPVVRSSTKTATISGIAIHACQSRHPASNWHNLINKTKTTAALKVKLKYLVNRGTWLCGYWLLNRLLRLGPLTWWGCLSINCKREHCQFAHPRNANLWDKYMPWITRQMEKPNSM